MKGRKIFVFGGSLILSGLGFYVAFQSVPFEDLAEYIVSVNYWWLMPAILVSIISYVIRALRWRLIVSDYQKISFWQAFNSLMIAFMTNCLLPGRVGEVVRPVYLRKTCQIPIVTGAATVVVERGLDLVCLLLFFLLLFHFIDIDPKLSITIGEYQLDRKSLLMIGYGMIQVTIALILAIALICYDRTRRIFLQMIEKIPRLFFFLDPATVQKIENVVSKPLAKIVMNTASGFALVKKPAMIIKCFSYSLVVWIVSAFSYYLVARGCPGIDLTFFSIFAVMIIVCFFIALPSVPGFWGVWEAGGVFALAIFSVPRQEALGYTLLNHVVQVGTVIVVGLIVMMVTGIKLMSFSEKETRRNCPDDNA